MTDQEMINSFLATHSPITCPDHTIISNGMSRVSNTRNTISTLKSVKHRADKHFKCEKCGFIDTETTRETNAKKAGFVGGVYRGDTWCYSCRKQGIQDLHNQLESLKYVTKLIVKFGSKENYQRYVKLSKITIKDIEKFNISELVNYIVDAEWLLKIMSHSLIVSRKVKAELLLNNLSEVKEDNWDNWDEPLGK